MRELTHPCRRVTNPKIQSDLPSLVLLLSELRHGQAFLPPSLQGTVVTPGFHGGATWSGAAFDPTTGILYFNSNNVPNTVTLRPASAESDFDYQIDGYITFPDPEGYPAIKPPWGVLNALDVNRAKYVCQPPLSVAHDA